MRFFVEILYQLSRRLSIYVEKLSQHFHIIYTCAHARGKKLQKKLKIFKIFLKKLLTNTFFCIILYTVNETKSY